MGLELERAGEEDVGCLVTQNILSYVLYVNKSTLAMIKYKNCILLLLLLH